MKWIRPITNLAKMTEQSTSEGFLFVGPDQILEQHALFNLCRGSRDTLRLIYYSCAESKPSGVKGVGGIVLCLHKLSSLILNLMTKGLFLPFETLYNHMLHTFSTLVFFNFWFWSNYNFMVIINSKVVHRVPMYPLPNFPQGDFLTSVVQYQDQDTGIGSTLLTRR